MPQSIPKITVLMTVHNGARYLVEAIESVLAQTMDAFELLIVDDASSDATSAILEGFAGRDRRVRVLRNETNLGPYPSANRGLAASRAPIIARLDADDASAPDRLLHQLAFLDAHPGCVLVGGGYRSLDGEGKVRFVRRNPLDFPTAAFVTRLRMPIIHPSFAFRGQLPDGEPVRYDERFPVAGDYALAAALAQVGEIASLDAIVVDYRMHAGNISSTKLDSQRHFAHQVATSAVAAHYPPRVAFQLQELLTVYYHRAVPTLGRLESAVRGLEAALAHDGANDLPPSVRERAAGICAEAFFSGSHIKAAQFALPFAWRARRFLLPLARRARQLHSASAG